MADITCCEGTNCPLKEKCYRFTAPKSELYQSYLMKEPFREEKGKTVCDLFWLDRRQNKK
jgi:hypothetical protein